jgi:dTMP kinase
VNPSPRGRFLVIEGIDGAGKSTLIEALREWLPASGLMPAGRRLVVTREPGGTGLGRRIRSLLLDAATDEAPCATSELLLYAADRAQHVERLIRPALLSGDWVLSDRFCGSTMAYQGWGRELSHELILRLEDIATAGLCADVTLWLDLPPAEARRRRHGRPADRIEAGGEPFLDRVAAGFRTLAGQRGWLRLEADQPADRLCASARERLRGALSPASGHG